MFFDHLIHCGALRLQNKCGLDHAAKEHEEYVRSP